jgi:hypothetical protein
VTPTYKEYIKQVKEKAKNGKQDTATSYLKRKSTMQLIVDEQQHIKKKKKSLGIIQYESDSYNKHL